MNQAVAHRPVLGDVTNRLNQPRAAPWKANANANAPNRGRSRSKSRSNVSLRRKRETAGLQENDRAIKRQYTDHTRKLMEEFDMLPCDAKLGKNSDLYPMEYIKDIQELLRKSTCKYPINPNYMHDVQEQLVPKMRSIVLDWLMDGHMKFKTTQESIHLAVNLFDRYMSHQVVEVNQLQLVAATSLFIAAKYEDIYPPDLRDFLDLMEDEYTAQQMIQCELNMLNKLEFNITVPTASMYLQRYLIMFDVQIESETWAMAHYLLELGIVSYELLQHTSDKQAGAVLFLLVHMGFLNIDKKAFIGFLTKSFPDHRDLILHPEDNRRFWKDVRGKRINLMDEIKMISKEYLYQVLLLKGHKHKEERYQAVFRKWSNAKAPFFKVSLHRALPAYADNPAVKW